MAAASARDRRGQTVWVSAKSIGIGISTGIREMSVWGAGGRGGDGGGERFAGDQNSVQLFGPGTDVLRDHDYHTLGPFNGDPYPWISRTRSFLSQGP